MTEEPRDRTLDSFVAVWAAPPPCPEFHSRVRGAFEREFVKAPRWRRWNGALAWRFGKGLLGSAAIGALFFLVIGLAFPQTERFRLPWLHPSLTMDFEQISYSDNGTPRAHVYRRIVPPYRVLWTYSTDYPYDDMLKRFVSEANYLLERITSSFLENTEQAREDVYPLAAYAQTGCVGGYTPPQSRERILGYETLLGYSTTLIQWDMPHRPRITEWLAPSLGCRALKVTLENLRPDGSYHLISETRALNVVP